MEATALGQTSVQITDTETGAVFPEAEDNRHYQEFKKWLAEGNVPEEHTCTAVCEVPQ
jgi:hypothetical protein